MKNEILKHLKDYQNVETELRSALESNQRALMQAQGAMWYIRSVLLPTLEGNEQAVEDSTSPPRPEQVE